MIKALTGFHCENGKLTCRDNLPLDLLFGFPGFGFVPSNLSSIVIRVIFINCEQDPVTSLFTE